MFAFVYGRDISSIFPNKIKKDDDDDDDDVDDVDDDVDDDEDD